MLTTLLIFAVLLAFIFLGFPIFMALLITGIIFIITGGNSMQLTIIKMLAASTACPCSRSRSSSRRATSS